MKEQSNILKEGVMQKLLTDKIKQFKEVS